MLTSSLSPGGVTGWYTHPAPVFIVVTEGTLVIEMEDREPKTIRAGEAWRKPVNVRLRGTNPNASEPEKPLLEPAVAPWTS
jgi:quercetin dioxygenase-like cupin family protein